MNDPQPWLQLFTSLFSYLSLCPFKNHTHTRYLSCFGLCLLVHLDKKTVFQPHSITCLADLSVTKHSQEDVTGTRVLGAARVFVNCCLYLSSQAAAPRPGEPDGGAQHVREQSHRPDLGQSL